MYIFATVFAMPAERGRHDNAVIDVWEADVSEEVSLKSICRNVS